MFKERILITFLISLIFIAGFDFLKPHALSSRIEAEYFWTNKTHAEKKFDLVIIGDSRVYRGVSPEIMAERLKNLKIINFGYSALGMDQIIFKVAEEKIDPLSKNKIIVIGLTPYSLTEEAAKNESYILGKNRKPIHVWLTLNIKPRLKFFEPTTPLEIFNKIIGNQKGYYENFKNDGWVASYKIPLRPEESLESYRQQFGKNKVSSRVIDNLINQIKIWKSDNIKIFGFRVPSSQKMVELENQLSGFSENSFIKKFEEAGGFWLDFGQKDYQSYDGSHLTQNSALNLSADLANQIKNRLDAKNNVQR